MVESTDRLQGLQSAVESLHEHVLTTERAHAERLDAVAPEERASAQNLVDYLALRQHDLREIQSHLAACGLSSLGRSEPHVLASLQAVRRVLSQLTGQPTGALSPHPPVDHLSGPARLRANADRLLGPVDPEGAGRVMVTLPAAAAERPELVRNLLSAGMTVARINSAHDDVDAWHAMIRHVGEARTALDRSCRILFDLRGPKLRTCRILTRKRGHRFAPAAIRVRSGDRLTIAPDDSPTALLDLANPDVPIVTCSLGQALSAVRVGERLLIDDGKVEGRVDQVDDGLLSVVIDRAPHKGAPVRIEKGINLPDSTLPIRGLTDEDRAHLSFGVRHADMIGLSFVDTAADVLELFGELERLGPTKVGIVLKIERRLGFDHLPEILLAALRSPPVGVMVARGDLAVEVGYGRLAEVQEEILWICEAAHVPVIWATQVLDRLVKKGAPSRPEVTDAAMATRAECVMLNKGPHVLEAARFLGNVTERMAEHQQKKRSMLRRLRVSELAEHD